MDLQSFPLPYVFDVSKDINFATRTAVFESQKKQVQRIAIKPLTQWKIQCRGSNEQRKVLETFHSDMGGNSSTFLFTDENGVQQTVRFADAKLSLKLIREFTNLNSTHGNVVGFTSDITIELAL